MPFTITTEDFELAEELEKSAPSGVSVSIQYPKPENPRRMTRSAHDIIVTINFILPDARGIADGLIAIWLYEQIKNHACQICKGGKNIIAEKNAIRRLVQDELDFGNED